MAAFSVLTNSLETKLAKPEHQMKVQKSNIHKITSSLMPDRSLRMNSTVALKSVIFAGNIVFETKFYWIVEKAKVSNKERSRSYPSMIMIGQKH